MIFFVFSCFLVFFFRETAALEARFYYTPLLRNANSQLSTASKAKKQPL
jgi:hypothetical protein